MAPTSHPLRRISTGSLSSLARSTDRTTTSASDLDFLAPALTELADEAATLAANMQHVGALHDALGTFNEGFAAYLYALKMNAFCIEWPEAPDPSSWARRNAAEDEKRQHAVEAAAAAAAAAPGVPAPTTNASRPRASSPHAGDMTYATAYSGDEGSAPTTRGVRGGRGGVPRPAAGGLRRPAAPPSKSAVAAKKRRELAIAGIIDTQLPLEYRGGDLDARVCMEKVIGKLMDGGDMAIADLTGPELVHPKVNKALIALVAKKLVGKSSARGRTLYRWIGGQ